MAPTAFSALFGVKNARSAKGTAVLSNSAPNRLPIHTHESINRRKHKGNFPAERTHGLDRLGLDADGSHWEEGFAAMERFKARNGHCRVPWRHMEGEFKLGKWVVLNAIGFVWNGHERAWEEGFAALTTFKACNGHCYVPRFHVEGEYRLGQWVSVQRLSRDVMSAERRGRLDAIGFVWDGRDRYWEAGFQALALFKAREGHCRVPSLHIENVFKLGQWVATRRRSKDKMSYKRKMQLNKIGFVWRVM
jgi:hypothetical protein